MKILYDHQIFTSQRYGGISRYFYEIVSENNTHNIEYEIPLLVSSNYYISDHKLTKHFNLFSNTQFRGKQRLFNFINKPNSILKLKQQQFDIFHPTYYDPYFLHYLNGKPFVLTVYDMIHEKFNEIFPSDDRTTTQKKLLVEKATKIIAISENTKRDLIYYFGTDESKIDVVYLGNSMFPKTDIKLDFNIPEKYILFVGDRGTYKNFELFIKSISIILNQDKEIFVLCVGGRKFDNKEIQFFSELKISKQIFQYNLSDASLAYFYKNALFFIFPSLYEGFGIPILESFACGCPLLCSNTSSLPEIAGEAAYYFDPYNECSIKNAVLDILENLNLRKELIRKGYEQLEKFSWKKTAEETKNIYKNISI